MYSVGLTFIPVSKEHIITQIPEIQQIQCDIRPEIGPNEWDNRSLRQPIPLKLPTPDSANYETWSEQSSENFPLSKRSEVETASYEHVPLLGCPRLVS